MVTITGILADLANNLLAAYFQITWIWDEKLEKYQTVSIPLIFGRLTENY